MTAPWLRKDDLQSANPAAKRCCKHLQFRPDFRHNLWSTHVSHDA